MSLKQLFFSFVICCLFTSAIYAAEQMLVGEDEVRHRFGAAVAADSGTVVIGAPGFLSDGEFRGQAHIFQLDSVGWSETQTLHAADDMAYDLFGSAVAISDSLVLVGAQGDSVINPFTGAAYLFERIEDTWTQTQLFRSPLPISLPHTHPRDQFGVAVAVSDEFCVVGAPLNGGAVQMAGAVYVYRRDPQQPEAWILDDKLYAEDGSRFDNFGCAVAVSGHSLIVGASGLQEHTKKSGSAYIFKRMEDHWRQTAKLSPVDGNFQNQFGCSVDIDSATAVVGAFRDDVLDFDTGSAYIYHKENERWQETVKLSSTDADSGDYFGFSVALQKDYLIVGAPGDNDVNNDAGSIYVFLNSDEGWSQTAKKTPSNAGYKDKFGAAVDLNRQTSFVSAPRKTIDGTLSQGAIYVYDNIADLALPVELAFFQATVVEDQVLLEWVTQTEVDNLGFIIQRSQSSETWTEIASFQTDPELLGQGYSTVPTFYQYYDDSVKPDQMYFYRLGDVDASGSIRFHEPIQVTLGAYVHVAEQVPHQVQLFPAYPNPFNPETRLDFTIPQRAFVDIQIFDVRGRRITSLASGVFAAGLHTVSWDGRDETGNFVSSGLYVVHAKIGEFRAVQKLMFIE